MLADNGSTKADATVQLRVIVEKLSNKTGQIIHSVSMQHSDRIPKADIAAKLNGIPARTFREFMVEHLEAGQRDFILIPLFFGKSRAITSFVPSELELLKAQFGHINFDMTEVLYPLPKGNPKLVDILYEHAVDSTKYGFDNDSKNIVLVDHGSPLPAVNAVRQQIASELKKKLASDIQFNQAAMERRQGKEYDFNGELLSDYLNRMAQAGETKITVLLLFLLAGTHAGENGDIVQICNQAIQTFPKLSVSISPLIGQNDILIDCLADRLANVLT